MVTTYVYALASVSLVGLISLCGVFAIPVTRQTLSKVTFVLVSLATGAMLGNAFVHLLPESFEYVFAGRITAMSVSLLIVAGFLFCFILEKVMNLSCHHGFGHHHEEGHCHEGEQCHGSSTKGLSDIHPTGYMSLLSHGMDNFTDGILIGATYLISVPAGLATTLAIVLHEIPMEFGAFGVLVQAGFSRKGAILVNFFSAVVAAIGTLAVLVFGSMVHSLPVVLTPIGAGIVLYVTAAGLVPRLQGEHGCRQSLVQVLIMALGLGVMVAVKFLG